MMMYKLLLLGLCLHYCQGKRDHDNDPDLDDYDDEDLDKTKDNVVTKKSLITEKAVIVTFQKVGELAPNQTSLEFQEGRSHQSSAFANHGSMNFIVNGQKASRRTSNYVVTVQIFYGDAWYHVCGGAILSKTQIITAAHCMRWWGYNPNKSDVPYRVGCGWHDLSLGTMNYDSQTFTVIKSLRHPGYKYRGPNVDSGIQPYDLAIITIDGRIEYDYKVKPIKIPNPRDTFADEECEIVGWGDTENGFPNILHTSEMTVMGQSLCKQFWRIGQSRIYPVELCTWDWPKRLSSTCSGDSGGPLICRDKLAGIVAWGLTYCNGCFPSVNTRVSAFVRWIAENTAR